MINTSIVTLTVKCHWDTKNPHDIDYKEQLVKDLTRAIKAELDRGLWNADILAKDTEIIE